jgi:heme/copper-type cytochrome/quinol oxidase subunit 2
VTTAIVLLVFAGCDMVAPNSEPIDAMDAELIGQEYRFYIRYPGDDLTLHTSDDRFGVRNLYVPEGAQIRLRMSSRDYIYTVEIPEMKVYEAAVPDLFFDVQFLAKPAGSHQLLGSQMCGYDHEELLGELIVQPAAEFRRTMQKLSNSPLITSGRK